MAHIIELNNIAKKRGLVNLEEEGYTSQESQSSQSTSSSQNAKQKARREPQYQLFQSQLSQPQPKKLSDLEYVPYDTQAKFQYYNLLTCNDIDLLKILKQYSCLLYTSDAADE